MTDTETDTSSLSQEEEEEVEEIVDIKVSEKLSAIENKLNDLFNQFKKPVEESTDTLTQSGATAVDVVIDSPSDLVEDDKKNGTSKKKRGIRRKRFV